MFSGLLQKYKKALIVLVVLIVLFVGFQFLGGSSSDGLTSEPVSGVIPEEGGDLITLLLELKSIKLDTGILQDPIFLTLQDFSVTLAPEPVGRVNPFAPIGAVSAPTSTTTTEEE